MVTVECRFLHQIQSKHIYLAKILILQLEYQIWGLKKNNKINTFGSRVSNSVNRRLVSSKKEQIYFRDCPYFSGDYLHILVEKLLINMITEVSLYYEVVTAGKKLKSWSET